MFNHSRGNLGLEGREWIRKCLGWATQRVVGASRLPFREAEGLTRLESTRGPRSRRRPWPAGCRLRDAGSHRDACPHVHLGRLRLASGDRDVRCAHAVTSRLREVNRFGTRRRAGL